MPAEPGVDDWSFIAECGRIGSLGFLVGVCLYWGLFGAARHPSRPRWPWIAMTLTGAVTASLFILWMKVMGAGFDGLVHPPTNSVFIHEWWLPDALMWAVPWVVGSLIGLVNACTRRPLNDADYPYPSPE